ncbi:MAG: O-antigen ligase family protein [Chloroflexi bacterium]|nr:O-antigen ligase family protein [Chloroflexota bacterium]
MTQYPLLVTGITTFTNLMIVVYIVVALAVVSLAPHFVSFLRGIAAGKQEPTNYVYRRRLTIGPFTALVAVCAVSSCLSQDTGNGLRWTMNLLLGGLIWLAVPLWLAEDADRKIRRLRLAMVAGAALAASVGICEVVIGTPFAGHLLWFKAAPTAIGPYLRLSGTFEYANIAAMYFELALPFAVVGLLGALVGARRRSAVAAWLGAVDLLFCGLLLTYSRGALLGLAIGAFIAVAAPPRGWLMRRLRDTRGWLLGIAGNLVLVAALAVLVSPSLVLLRWTSDSDQEWYRAAYTGQLPASVRAGEEIKVPVTVSNLGPLTWSPTDAHPYHLSYHWLYPSGRVALFDGARSRLSADVLPGHRETVVAAVRAPSRPGRYDLVWDMVQEGVTWFSLKSATYTTQPVRVVGSAGSDGGHQAAPSRPAPITLPTALAAPSRAQLWAAALRMVATHPLFGIGPGGFRLHYGTYLRPRQRDWDRRILANSLPLEMFADLGLLGGGLFFALLAAILWPLLLALRNGQVVAWWQIALIGSMAAFLGHGLVDYILISNAIFFLFWFLCGLVATASDVLPGQLGRP